MQYQWRSRLTWPNDAARVLLLLLLPLTTMACDDDDAVTQPEPNHGSPNFQIVSGRTLPKAGHKVGSRRSEEEAALAKLDPKLREVINRPGVRAESSTDPEVARLISTIYEIREADAMASEVEESRAIAKRFGTRVTVALVEAMPVADARAMVLRNAAGEQRNVILLTKSATAIDLSDAIITLFRLREAHGDRLHGDMKVVVQQRSRGAPSINAAQMERYIARLNAAPKKTVYDIGQVPAIEIKLGPVKERKKA